MNILAVNSSDDHLSVALLQDDEITATERMSARNHNRDVLVCIDQIVADSGLSLNDLHTIAFGKGPGSFTGLRIAAGVAQGLAFGLKIPRVPVSCLAAIAQKQKHEKVFVAMDAKRNQIYWGLYVRNGEGCVSLLGKERLTEISAIRLPDSGWLAAGSGWDIYQNELRAINADLIVQEQLDQRPHAADIAKIGAVQFDQGKGVDACLGIPKYLSGYITG